jgi:protein O-mannosyl-transferase
MSSESRHSQRRIHLVSLGLAAAAIAVFAQTARNGFVSFDDGEYVYENPAVLAGLSLKGLAWAFTTRAAANWHPLTWLSHMLDVTLFGANAGAHHLVSLAFHAASTVLLFHVLRTATGRLSRSALVAALFCVHPLHVESVAWLAERKDVLSTFFGMLALLAYVSHARRPSAPRYLGALVAFGLSLLAKPMLVTLPFVLLLLDGWPLDRVARSESDIAGPQGESHAWWQRRTPVALVVEKVPFLILSALSAGITFFAQRQGGAVSSIAAYPLGTRVENALVAYVAYLAKAIWPSGLSYFYPFDLQWLGWRSLAAAAVLAAVSVVAVSQVRARPFLLTGWLWYVGTLLPVIGIVKVGSQAMADRYTYFPLIGIFIAAVWSVPDRLLGTRRGRIAAGVAAAFVLVALATTSWFQVRHWRNGSTLFLHALDVDPENWAALSNLGGEMLLRGNPSGAEVALAESVRIRPENALAHAGLGLALEQQGRTREAAASFRKAALLEPGNAAIQLDLCRLLRTEGDLAASAAACKRGLALRPGDAAGHYSLGLTLKGLGRKSEGLAELEEARRLEPGNPLFAGAGSP